MGTGRQMTAASFRGARYQEFPTDLPGTCRYAMFDRHGGTSAGAFASLNASYTVGDSATAVSRNRKRVKDLLGIGSLVSSLQVHGELISSLKDRITEDCELEGYDALLSDQPNVGIMIQHADCQAVLLFDPVRRVVGAVHCGWRGSVANILGKTVKQMEDGYGSRPVDVKAVVSASLGPCCSEFIHHQQELPTDFQRFMVRHNHFDFWQISRDQLANAGLCPSSVSVTGICTACSPDYFSYRRAKRLGAATTGRNCSVIALGQRQ